jgi:acyl-CoA thioester hydrolase
MVARYRPGPQIDTGTMIEIYEHMLIVSDRDIDQVGHVNNVVYLQWMQDAAVAHSSALGWSAARYQQHGAGWVARLHQIEYLRPAFAGDEVIVRTWVADMKKVTSLRRYQIIRNDPPKDEPTGPWKETVLAVAHTNWAFIDYTTQTPKRVPLEIASAYRIVADSKPET